MAIDPISIGLAGASALTSVVGGIFGANQQKSNERAAEKAAKKAAKAQNRYNKRKFKNDKYNFLQNRQFNYEQAMKKYEYDTQVQNLVYDTQVRAYNKDQQNLSNQLAYNDIAARQAYMREQNVMQEIKDEQAISRQQIYIEGLKNKASARLGQSGASNDRAVLMALAEKGRQLAIMDASFTGAIRESNINMFDIAINKIGADDRARAATMLKPSEPIPLVIPEITPMPKFTEPAEAIPGFVPSSSATSTILGGIASGLGAFAGIDFTNSNPTPTPAPGGGSTAFPINGFGGGANVAAYSQMGLSMNPFTPASTTQSVPVIPFGS